MAKQLNSNEIKARTRKTIEDLFSNVPEDKRCPHIRRDDSGIPYCGKDLAEGEEPAQDRYLPCDTASLQLWCLDAPNNQNCIYFNGERFP